MAPGTLQRKEVVLITGCSSGIGRSTVLAAHASGHTVIATARRPETLDDLPADVHRVTLDVCDPDSVSAAVQRSVELTGGITALVNNAGFGQSGPIEMLTPEQITHQFETNVYGPVRLIQAVLPLMRERRHGRIVNVSSAAGKFSTPFLGIYCASKFALEAISDALRVEVAPWDIRVVVVEPGPIATNFGDVALHSVGEEVLGDPSNPYYARANKVTEMEAALGPLTKQPEDVAKMIVRGIEAKRPKTRYTITLPAKMAKFTQVLPDKLLDVAQAKFLGS